MKNLVIYDPKPFKQDYLAHKFFPPLIKYGETKNIPITNIDSLDSIKNSVVIMFANYFTKDTIPLLKNNGNRLISFDVNDSSWLDEAYRFSPALSNALDLIFKFSGIPKVQYSDEVQIANDLTYYKHKKYYIENAQDWDSFCFLRDSDKIVPMPHIPWQQFNIIPVVFHKKAKVLIRGGNHYLRYHLFLNLAKHGLIGKWSAFILGDYHKPSMDDLNRYCPDCVAEYLKNRRISYMYYKDKVHTCNNPLIDWSDGPEEGVFQNHNNHKWNNKCIPLFYWLTERFIETHGPLDMDLVENALNGFWLRNEDFGSVLAQHLFYGDYKWIYSIDIPPRFWESSAAKTINLLPRWTSNQQHFPNLKEGEHYIAFDEAFEGLERIMDISQAEYEHITNNCRNLYSEWIAGAEYGISTKLMDRIFDKIEEVL